MWSYGLKEMLPHKNSVLFSSLDLCDIYESKIEILRRTKAQGMDSVEYESLVIEYWSWIPWEVHTSSYMFD